MSLFHTQEDLRQDEALECGTQEEAVECGSHEEAGVSGSQEEVGLSGSQEKPGTSRSLTKSQVPPLRLPTKRPRKGIHLQDSALRLIQEASAFLRATPTPEEVFACMAATKLQGMQEGQRQLCEDLFYKVLTKGMRGEITPNTHVSDVEGSIEGRPESDDLCSVWSDKRCGLLYDHSMGTQMSSAAFRISGTSGPDCTPLDMDSSGHQFCSKIIDVCPGGQRLHQFLLFLQRCLPLCLVLSP
ncbi:hypothetical protein AB205_0163520 [Aquarana catesbeiana]|uniref:Uncharacterized protein n=1 Tax=Aquarana catesbeiana TaxID=8400 RepID=A0A2G9QIP9_AQUCT|nr:hypothetical protein AB205_0163520 [Aquarana catesbeiana]